MIRPMLIAATMTMLASSMAPSQEPAADVPQLFPNIFATADGPGRWMIHACQGKDVMGTTIEGDFRPLWKAIQAGDARGLADLLASGTAVRIPEMTGVLLVKIYAADRLEGAAEVRVLDGPLKDRIVFVPYDNLTHFEAFPLEVGQEGVLKDNFHGQWFDRCVPIAWTGDAYDQLFRAVEMTYNLATCRQLIASKAVTLVSPGTRVRVKGVYCSADRVEQEGRGGPSIKVQITSGPNKGKMGWVPPITVMKPPEAKSSKRAPAKTKM